MEIGDRVKVTPKDGQAYSGFLRSVHEGGYTIWMDEKAQDEGEVRTVSSDDASVEADAAPVKGKK